jgi:hypothetical protein
MNDQQRAGRIAHEALRARSQRIRVGITGLAGIVLIVGLITVALLRMSESATTAQANAVANGTQVEPQPAPRVAPPVEPLTELGVAPGATEQAAPPSQQQ